MPKTRLDSSWWLLLGSALLACGGDGDGGTNPPPRVPTAVNQAGNNQTGVVRAPLPAPISVTVLDQVGNPMSGVMVTFVVTAGGGDLQPTNPSTNASGVASTSWRLGPVVGTNNNGVSAAIGGYSGPSVGFVASATIGDTSRVTVSSGNGQTATVGTPLPQPIAVVVTDLYNNVKPGVTVNWAAAQGSVSAPTSVTDASGVASATWTIGTMAGVNNQSATASVDQAFGSPVVFTASGTAASPATLAIVSGNSQTAMVGTVLVSPLVASVTDSNGNPVAGVNVSWEAATGGGWVSSGSVPTSAAGTSSVTRTLGATVGTQTTTASVAGTTPTSVTFNETGTALVSNYTITLRYLTAMSPARQAVFDAAAARWQGIITGDVSDVPLNYPANVVCGPGYPAINETVDDVLIYAQFDSIDGPGKVLGSAGPCGYRVSGGVATRFTIVGTMRFDSADVAAMESDGIFTALILHEMGHVLGIGSLWNMNPSPPILPPTPLLINPAALGGVDPYFNGTNAIAQYLANEGGSYPGTPVPVEAGGGQGTRDSHWRESVLGRELMTGYVSNTSNPLSSITVASLQDMGYQVSFVNADPYTVNPANLMAPGAGLEIHLREAVPDWTIKAIDAQGRIVGQR